MLCNVARLLAPCGVYVVISFRRRELLLPLLTSAELPWHVEHELLPMKSGSPASICFLHKHAGGECLAQPQAVARHMQNVVDWWYKQEDPLLTTERELQVREAWSAAMATKNASWTAHSDISPMAPPLAADHLPLPTAFEVLFTAAEREEIGFDGFLSDLESLVGRGADGAMPHSLSLEDALTYLRSEQ